MRCVDVKWGMAALQLLPLCTIDSVLTEPTVVGKGVGVIQENYLVMNASVKGPRLKGTMQGEANWDWMSVPGGIGTLRVRATIVTDDGASINVRYEGRADIRNGNDGAAGYVAPVFTTSSPRYMWLNLVQAVGRGLRTDDRIHWEWYLVAEAS